MKNEFLLFKLKRCKNVRKNKNVKYTSMIFIFMGVVAAQSISMHLSRKQQLLLLNKDLLKQLVKTFFVLIARVYNGT